jgi:putative transposase
MRYVWNWMLSQRSELYKASGKGTNYFEQANQLKYLKSFFPWLKECPSQALQQNLRDLDRAFKNFFTGKAKYPKFKSKGRHDSIRLPQGLEVHENRVKLPKLGWVKFRKSREIKGAVKHATISKVGRHWYIAFNVEEELASPRHPSTSELAIDMGVNAFATLSSGIKLEGARALEKYLKKLTRYQRALSRKAKGSSNWKRAKEKLGKIHLKISNIRKDSIHKLSTWLSKSHAKIRVENLDIAQMTKSAKGTEDAPGKGVKRKAWLNRQILDQAWGEFFRQLEYKLEWLGGVLEKVDPRYTSQACSQCGHIAKKNRKSQSEFKCIACGYEADADINAARNINAAGHAVSACGDIGLVRALAQESHAL